MAELANEQREKMQKLVAGLKVKAEKIRELDRAGYQRSAIATFLKIRYQHVRNVLVRSQMQKEKLAETTDPLRPQEWVQVAPDGRVVIPAPYRRALGIEGGGHVLMRLENDELHLVGRDTALRRAQELVARYVPEGTSLVDELIAERRAEVERESRE